MIPFSVRHKKLIEDMRIKGEKFKISKTLRRKIFRTLEEFHHSWLEYPESGFNYYEKTFNVVKKEFLKITGEAELKAYVDDSFKKVNTLENFILGTKPEFVLDIIEIWYDQLDLPEAESYETDMNTIFKTEDSQFKFIEGEFIILDSDFLESEVRSHALKLLKENGFEKANLDFMNARRRLSAGDFNGSIVEANNALESLLKKILDKEKYNQGNLKKALIQSGLVPDYFQAFVEHFENLLQSAFTIANKSSRHGKKEVLSGKNKIDEPVASFLLNLVGSIIIFIVERYIEEPQ